MLEVAQPHLLTAKEYLTLDVPERTELLGGVIYDVSLVNPPHTHAVRQLNRALSRGLDDAFVVAIQDPIVIGGWRGRDAPLVDVAVIQAKSYTQTPTAEDAFAFIEVSHSTYLDDRNYKIPLYVRANVQAWIVNIERRQVEFYSTVEHLALPNGVVIIEDGNFEVCGVTIRVADLFDEA